MRRRLTLAGDFLCFEVERSCRLALSARCSCRAGGMGRSNLAAHRCADRLSSSRGTVLTTGTPGSRSCPGLQTSTLATSQRSRCENSGCHSLCPDLAAESRGFRAGPSLGVGDCQSQGGCRLSCRRRGASPSELQFFTSLACFGFSTGRVCDLFASAALLFWVLYLDAVGSCQ